ncbi:MAG: hypothetical protein RJQ01_03110 [Microcella sp.]|uniref:hypothetical protein n=1 Tax=Microcella sp. TaxID=1913979 RepID=UPI00331481F4
MTWGNDVVQWWASDDGWRVLTGAVIPALSILVAGVVAALIARGSTKRLLKHHDRDALTSAVGAFVLAGRTAAEWHDHDDAERRRVDQLISEAETRLRLLPIPGAALAANWASHQLESMKGHSSGFRFQAQQTLGDYRDALITWSQKPRTAKKLFGADLERWRYETAETAEPPVHDMPPVSSDATPTEASSDASPSTRSATAPQLPEPPATTGPVRDPALAAALAAAPPPSSRTAASPAIVDDAEDAPRPMAASIVRERITSTDQD